MADSQIMTPPFESKETLFYKSVKRVAALFVILPLAFWSWQKQKGIQERILLL
ncbi:hypothetical protein SAMN05216563_108148 [Phytobacter palmae]|nr:hypothetical protein SAMN05216563_108148 [Phytobacter palmae]